MYNIYIEGIGHEVTQGSLPKELANEIELAAGEDFTLEDYLKESVAYDDRINWYEIDDNFHGFGPGLDSSEIVIELDNAEVLRIPAVDIKQKRFIYTAEVYPIEDMHHEAATLTCIQDLEGKFLQDEFEASDFDANKLELEIVELGDTVKLINNVYYDGKKITVSDIHSALVQDFFVDLDY